MRLRRTADGIERDTGEERLLFYSTADGINKWSASDETLFIRDEKIKAWGIFQ